VSVKRFFFFQVCTSVASESPVGIDNLIETLEKTVSVDMPIRDRCDAPLLFAYDHCFGVKGRGSVITGTVISGKISVGSNICIPALTSNSSSSAGSSTCRKVKSIQRFHVQVSSASHGDRAAILVQDMSADDIAAERGLILDASASVRKVKWLVAVVEKVSYFKAAAISSKSKFHITLGHDTTTAQAWFFKNTITDYNNHCNDVAVGLHKSSAFGGRMFSQKSEHWPSSIDLTKHRMFYLEELQNTSNSSSSSEEKTNDGGFSFVLLKLDSPVLYIDQALLIGSRLDLDSHSPQCRIAFYGKVIGDLMSSCPLPTASNNNNKPSLAAQVIVNDSDRLALINVRRSRIRTGYLERASDQEQATNFICSDFNFKKETDLNLFIGLKVFHATTKTIGKIESSFGKSGKVKVSFEKPLTNLNIDNKGKIMMMSANSSNDGKQELEVILPLEKLIFSGSREGNQSKATRFVQDDDTMRSAILMMDANDK
jgi:selenocysteine-specific elongation factor